MMPVPAPHDAQTGAERTPGWAGSPRSRLFVVLLCACLLGLAGARAGYAASTPRDYRARIAAALTDVQAARHSSGTARERAVAGARALLSPRITVRAGAVRVRADLASVRADLTPAHPSDARLADAARQLGALRDALAAPAARYAAPDARKQRALDNILNAPPFVPAFDPLGALLRFLHGTPLGAAWDAVVRFVDGLLGPAAHGAGNVLPYVAGVIVAAALIFVAARLFGVLVPATPPAPDETGGATLTLIDARAARARAAELATAGGYREAARYLFIATLLALDETGRLRIDGATGNRDLLRQARAVPRLSEALTPVVSGFEAFWFGHAPISRDDYERYRRLNEQVVEVLR